MTARTRGRWIALVLGTTLGIGTAGAQIPDEFTNLQVLPKDISKRELVSTMRGFAMALGTRCNHCHVGEKSGSLEGMDFPSDDLEQKKVARGMMKMVSEINGKLLPATGKESFHEVGCITCHRGLQEPETLADLLTEVIEKDGVPAAVARYTELREKYYGMGAYDFSAGTLNSIGESLSRGGDLDGAIELMKMNVEVHPDAAFSHLLLGQIYGQKGDKEAAIAAVERSLEIEPDNDWAKGILERLRSSE